MTAIALPELPACKAQRGVFINRAQLAGLEMFSVTAWRGASRPPTRRWFTDWGVALANAAGYADSHSLPLFDLTAKEAE